MTSGAAIAILLAYRYSSTRNAKPTAWRGEGVVYGRKEGSGSPVIVDVQGGLNGMERKMYILPVRGEAVSCGVLTTGVVSEACLFM